MERQAQAINETLRDKILEYIGEEDISAAELARRAHLNVSTIYEICRCGHRGVRVETLLKLCDAMCMDPTTILDY